VQKDRKGLTATPACDQMPPKKKGKKGKGGKGKKNDKQKEEEDNALFDLFINNFKKASVKINGSPPSVAILKVIKGPSSDEKGAEDLPGWYDRKKNLQVVDIRLGPALCRSICRSLLDSKYKLLQRISLVSCEIFDAGVTSLCEVLTGGSTVGVKPTILELVACGITSKGCEHLSLAMGSGGNTCLQKLSLDHNKAMGNRGYQSLCIGIRGNSSLKTLSVKCCGLEGVGMGNATALLLSSSSTILENLHLSENKLTPRGLSTVARSLKKNTALKILGLAENNIDADFEAEGYDIFMRSMNHLRLALQLNATLQSLDLSFNTITEDGALQLLPALSPESAERNNTLKWFKLTTLLSQTTFKQLSRMGKTGGSKKGKGKGKGKGKKKGKKKKK
jgi:hypothetical protein